MPDRALRESLEQLRGELDRLETGDAASRARLERLVADIEARLEDVELHESVVEGVRDAIEHFEVEHPRVTGILNHVMMVVANMGI